MKINLMLAIIVASPVAALAGAPPESARRTVYTNLDLFAYSEPVSIYEFARGFNDELDAGKTAFTHDEFELGFRWENWRLAFVQRFDYITEFTEDTARVHHSEKNGLPIDRTREYDLGLEVERLQARGIKLGHVWHFGDALRLDVAVAWYTDATDLQSGKALGFGDLEPITPALIDQANAIAGDLTADSRDLSALYDLIEDINTRVFIDYAWDEPAFGEPAYRKPVIVGDPNPVITGVDFSAPDGQGYALDASVFWEPSPRLTLRLKLMDIVNEFQWDNAPLTLASFDLYPFLHDAIGVAQDFVNGEV
ncbi:MAG: hypothetical protein HUJ31_04670, partial [Pseudomonadales bacterium]|nr:hypothetical protein [Pseudomonadales bacterium]